MKRLMALLIAFAMLAGAAGHADAARPAGSRLGFQVLAALNRGEGATFISPVSLTYALCMAAEGADGETLRQILDALELESVEEILPWQRELESSGLHVANALFAREDFEVAPAYIDGVRRDFGAECFRQTDVGAINRWVSDHTNQMIERLLEEDADLSECSVLLMNALCMDLRWRYPFDSEDTWPYTFHGLNGDSSVDMMFLDAQLSFGERDGVKFARLPYLGQGGGESGLYAIVAVPETAAAMDGLLSALPEAGAAYFTEAWQSGRDVWLDLPRFSVASDHALKGCLAPLGLSDLFDKNRADFSRMADVPQYVDEILQKVRVDVGEEGTKAAAITAVMLANAAMAFDEDYVPPFKITADRPFLFLVLDARAGDAVCFAGIVNDLPESKTDYSARNAQSEW